MHEMLSPSVIFYDPTIGSQEFNAQRHVPTKLSWPSKPEAFPDILAQGDDLEATLRRDTAWALLDDDSGAKRG
jgi:hypothetical protein